MGNVEITVTGIIGVSAFLIGSVMIWVVAFRTHKVWGWSTLLIPVIGPLTYAITHLKRSREGLITLVLGVLVIAFDGISSGWWYQVKQSPVLAEIMQQGKIRITNLQTETTIEQEEPSKEKLADNAGAVTQKAQAKKVVAKKLVLKRKVRRPVMTVIKTEKTVPVYKAIDVQQAQNYIGQNVRVTDSNNKSHEATITGLREQMLVFEKSYQGQGSVVFELRKRDIKKLESIAWVTKIERTRR